MNNRSTLLIGLSIALFGFLIWFYSKKIDSPSPIKVGVLHSFSGTMAFSEKSVSDGTLLAIKEINEKGGVLGRRLEPIIRDGKSDWMVFAEEARKLIQDEKVEVIFGCWMSSSRKTVKPIVEELNSILFYPLQYEGMESSPNIVYTGAAPNQQIIPAVKWAYDRLGKRFFLVGSDYIFPRTANAIIRDQVKALNGEIVGEEYILIGSGNVKPIIEKILEAKPDVILNTINGDTNLPFFTELVKSGITPDKIPTLSFSIAEVELQTLDPVQMAGNYAAWNYFQSIKSEINEEFVRNFKRNYGENSVTDDPIEAGYFGVYLWAFAAINAGSTHPHDVMKSIANQTFAAPEGIVTIDRENKHTWKIVRIGKIRPDGQFDIVWSSEKPIRPVPFPVYRSREEWQSFINDLYHQWGGRWENPGIQ